MIVFDTGNVASAASSAVVGPLALGKTYRAYVKATLLQTTTGIQQWSADSFVTFTLDVTGPTVTVNGPTGVQGTTSPNVTWTHHPGAGAQTGQTFYRVRMFNVTNLLTPVTDTGAVASSASSAVIGPLDPAISWRAVVNTAQTTYGVVQWSPDAGINFTINVTPATVSTVTATPNTPTASIAVVVTRNTSSPMWQTMDVEATYDGGATWAFVRGATRLGGQRGHHHLHRLGGAQRRAGAVPGEGDAHLRWRVDHQRLGVVQRGHVARRRRLHRHVVEGPSPPVAQHAPRRPTARRAL